MAITVNHHHLFILFKLHKDLLLKAKKINCYAWFTKRHKKKKKSLNIPSHNKTIQQNQMKQIICLQAQKQKELMVF